MHFKDTAVRKKGFTIVELLVVIAVIAILATISIVGYGAWKKSAATAQVKSDLNAVVAAMESSRTFGSGYPQSPLATTLTAFSPSTGVVVNGGGAVDGLSYCVDGTSSQDATVQYYVASETKDQGPLSGTCATRPTLPAPSVPSNLAITSSQGTTVGLLWTVAANATTYTVQCASDAGFIVGVQSVSVTAPTVTGTVSGLTLSSSYFCRVNAINANSTSAWSSQVSTTTTTTYGSLAVATSIEGYWTTPPQGFLFEDGSAVSRSTYSDLFSVIGTTYGTGDGSTTFNLPDSRGRTSVNLSTDVEFATVGQKTGSKTETLATAQIPAHTHIQNAHTHTQNAHNHNGGAQYPYVTNGSLGGVAVTSAAGAVFGFRYNDAPSATAVNQSTIAINQNTGGGGSHNNIGPSIVKMSAIKYSPLDSATATLPASTSIQGYWTTAPAGFAIENGAAVSRTSPTYSDLFAVIGTTYGVGDGSTTFNLPDSRGRVGVNKSPSDAEFNTMGEKYGTKTEALTIAQIPSHTHTQNTHTHTQNAHDHNGGAANPYVNDGSFGGVSSPAAGGSDFGFTLLAAPNATATNQNTTATNQNTGGGGSHNNIQPSIVKLSAIKTTAASAPQAIVATGTSMSGYWTAITPPAGYFFEDGTAVSRTTYSDLFAVIGTTYGVGDGSTTFNLPDSRGRVGVNKSPSDAEFNTMGEKYGTKTEALTIAQIPSHTHTQDAHTHIQNAHNHNGGFNGLYVNDGSFGGTLAMTANGGSYGFYYGPAPSVAAVNQSTTATNQNTGGGGSHNNIMPSIVKMFVIKY